MREHIDFVSAIDHAGRTLKTIGHITTSESWQAIKKPKEFLEVLDYDFRVALTDYSISKLVHEIKPNLPWADKQFNERISGIPYNPMPSTKSWPVANSIDSTQGGIFSHTYAERFWPKNAAEIGIPTKEAFDYLPNLNTNTRNRGIRFELGDLNDVINLLLSEPNTRQAYLPIWFPEDTGAVEGQRVPCSLGFLFRHYNGYLHITYKIRACDYLRHFRDDIYLACKLLFYVLDMLRGDNPHWHMVKRGYFKMQIDSLHCFALEKDKL